MGKITVVTSGKGGTGKSTVTSGIGAALSRLGKRVLIIDCDAGMRGVDLLLGINAELVFDISDIVNGNCNVLNAIYPCKSISGLYVLAAPLNEKNKISPSVMKQIVWALSKFYDYILIDCPAGIGAGFRASVAGADSAIVVAHAEPLSLRCSAKTRTMLNEYNITDIRLVINRFSKSAFRKLKVYDDLDDVVDAAGIRLLGIVPEDFKAVSLAQRGLPISGKVPASKAFDNIARRYINDNITQNNI